MKGRHRNRTRIFACRPEPGKVHQPAAFRIADRPPFQRPRQFMERIPPLLSVWSQDFYDCCSI